ncbi:MAG: flavodoxin domain-containing protein [Kiritimatiellae bacterium]|nr:flavodoxin domain-containing protein [Kiritimatiellia bacterium]MDD4736962.1 flavodoxin domain-containing protein [Kiritimatiellia bacterium]
MNETQVADRVNWVGYVDWSIRDFHGYETTRGSSYNAYLIQDEKNTLIDTVKGPYADDLLRNIQRHITLDKLDYIVCNHAEPDHSGALPVVMASCPQVELICDAKCKATLERYYDIRHWKIRVVKSGDSISIGAYSLQFLETPMAHWPESMATYLPECKLLFSMDAFGQHYATSGRFDDSVPLAVVLEEAKIYYANILMCYERPVNNALDAVKSLAPEILAPSHGIIWRTQVDKILSAYADWSVCKADRKVVILYDTMWQSTAKMAHTLYETVVDSGVQCKLISIRATHITDIVTECLDAAAIAVGSPTLNQTLMPQVAAALTYLMGLKPSGKSGFAFGSYGWGKGGPEAVNEYLEKMKFNILREPLKCQYAPDEQALAACREAGGLLVKAAELVG